MLFHSLEPAQLQKVKANNGTLTLSCRVAVVHTIKPVIDIVSDCAIHIYQQIHQRQQYLQKGPGDSWHIPSSEIRKQKCVERKGIHYSSSGNRNHKRTGKSAAMWFPSPSSPRPSDLRRAEGMDVFDLENMSCLLFCRLSKTLLWFAGSLHVLICKMRAKKSIRSITLLAKTVWLPHYAHALLSAGGHRSFCILGTNPELTRDGRRKATRKLIRYSCRLVFLLSLISKLDAKRMEIDA
ncbi:hypothetical protein STEG23_011339 [Scotinomys teguina]